MADDTRPPPAGVARGEQTRRRPEPLELTSAALTSLDPNEVPLDLWASLVRYARRHRGFSQGSLAAAIGVSQQTISKIEAAQICPHDRVKLRIASALGVEVRVLFPWPPSPREAGAQE